MLNFQDSVYIILAKVAQVPKRTSIFNKQNSLNNQRDGTEEIYINRCLIKTFVEAI